MYIAVGSLTGSPSPSCRLPPSLPFNLPSFKRIYFTFYEFTRTLVVYLCYLLLSLLLLFAASTSIFVCAFVVLISQTVIIFKLFPVEYLIEIHAWSRPKLLLLSIGYCRCGCLSYCCRCCCCSCNYCCCVRVLATFCCQFALFYCQCYCCICIVRIAYGLRRCTYVHTHKYIHMHYR